MGILGTINLKGYAYIKKKTKKIYTSVIKVLKKSAGLKLPTTMIVFYKDFG